MVIAQKPVGDGICFNGDWTFGWRPSWDWNLSYYFRVSFLLEKIYCSMERIYREVERKLQTN